MKKGVKGVSKKLKTASAKARSATRGKKAGEPPSLPAPNTPPIVGIGASAGGLEAFTELLRALPTDTGMAFVLVQHLEPKHDSVLTTLLARVTIMPVQEVREGMHVEPNHVYVIPANADLSLLDGLLHIVDRKLTAGRHLPIDYFFRSLAEMQGPRAVGVVLSGTASDGTAGIKAIKQEGGITLAQDPASAKFDGMPRNAIATGCVDFVLPPERIAKELARIVRHPFVGLPLHAIPPLPAHEQEWPRLFRLLRTATGVDFRFYKKSTIKRRLARRMAVNKADTLKAYLQILERNRAEMDALFEELLILVTEFFRDSEVFLALREKILPQILKAKPADEPIRIWSVGCSTGQEAYSIAISLLECLGEKSSGKTIQIFGTDVSEKAIEKARTGLYSEQEVKAVSKERLRRFFKRVDKDYQVNESLREMCIFARHDLIRDPPFSKLDLLSCRNVLIYFEIALQKRALAAFHYGLRSNGVLLLGKTESLGAHTELFTVVDRKLKFFRKNPAADVPFNMGRPNYEPALPGKPPRETLHGIDLEKEADRVVWERSAYAGLVVNDDLQILHFRGDTSPYLRPTPGKASLQLMRILREEILLEVRSAFQKARRSGKTSRAEGIEIRHDHHTSTVNVEVRPLIHSGPDKSFLILFEPVSAASAAPGKPATRRSEARKERETPEVRHLRGELVRTKEYVQSIIRDQESANEELKTANEEALSSMEELQSTNEELETAKEELQSGNEELVTLNEQLQNRNSELGQLSTDLGSVLSGVDIPIVILGPDRRIRRFTPPAEKLLGLISGDIGRPIGKLRIGVHIPDLDDLLSTVIEQGKETSREVQTELGRWCLLRIRPFRADDRVEGVLMAFLDIHKMKQDQEALQKDRNLISAILDAAKDLLVVVLDPVGRILLFNRRCQDVTGYSLKEVQGLLVWDFLLAPEDVAAVKASFGEVAGGISIQREGYWLTKDGRRLLISWSNSPVINNGRLDSVITTGIDVTARQKATDRADESEATVRAIMESAAQAVLACNQEGRIVLVNTAAEKMYGYKRDELIGQALESLVPEGLKKRHALHRAAWFKEPRNRPMGLGLDLAGRRKDGSEFPLEVSLSNIGSGAGTLAVAFVSDITERKKNERTLLEYKDHLQKLTGTLLSAQETGNREVARELHDVFSQELAAVGMEISSLKEDAKSGADLAGRLSELGKKITRLAADIHRTSRELHPAILEELGLEPALREECESFHQRSGIPVQFAAEGVPAGLPNDVALCLYRIAQESLRNIHKHAADADAVRVSLTGSPEGVTLRVEDTGDGFDLDEARAKGGLGLISMEERVRLVNGKLTVQSQPGKGTTVIAVVPLKNVPLEEKPA